MCDLPCISPVLSVRISTGYARYAPLKISRHQWVLEAILEKIQREGASRWGWKPYDFTALSTPSGGLRLKKSQTLEKKA